MGLFDIKDRQVLQTAINRKKMYDSQRPSEVNKDGVVSNSTNAYSYLNKKTQVPTPKQNKA